MNLAKLIVYNARRHEQSPAVAFSGGIATYRVLMGTISAFVEVMQTLRLPRGSLVLLDVQNPVYHIAMIYGLALLGLRSASVGTAHVTDGAGPRPAMFLTDRADLVASPGSQARLIDARWFAYEESRAVDYDRLQALPGFEADEVFRHIYSSGTTGRPKCVGLTGRTLERRAARSAFEMPPQAKAGPALSTMGFSTVLGTMMPFMTHTNGGLLCFGNSGAAVLQMIRTFSVSYLAGSVAQIQGVLTALGSAPPPPSLRSIFPAGSITPRSLMRELRRRLSSHVYGMYNSTEMGRVTILDDDGVDRPEGSAGPVAPSVTLEIVDDLGRALPRGRDGAIRIKSDELAVYVDEAGNTVPITDADGWFYPGDVGHLEADGGLVITGRTTEVINRGGVVVAPEAIEEVLRLDPRFTDLAVALVPGANGTDQIWAAVVCSGPIDEAAILAAARVRLNERTPNRIVIVDAIPRNENGKVMRNVLRDQLLALSKR